MRFEIRLAELNGGDEVAPVLPVSPDRPGRKTGLHHVPRKNHLPRHLPEVAVAEEHDGVAVLEGEVERHHREVEHLLRRRRSEGDGVGVAVTETTARELDVGLLGPDVAQTRAAAHDVDEDAGHLGADHVRDPLQHEAEARGRGEGHRSQARPPAAVHHVDRGHLAHGLKEDAVELGQQPAP